MLVRTNQLTVIQMRSGPDTDRVEFSLEYHPNVITFNLVWSRDDPYGFDLVKFYSTIPAYFHANALYKVK
jgi:hypothetical protein